MRRIFIFVLWLGASGTLGYISYSKFEVAERLEGRALGAIQTDNVSQLWFSPAGELIGIGQNDTQLAVRVWSGATGKLLRERSVSLPPAKNLPKPVFAVSADASKVASIAPAGVHVENLIPSAQESKADLGFKRPSPISALAFTGAGELAALYRDGEIELWDLASGRVTAAQHLEMTDATSLLANGRYVAAYSSASGDAFVFDTGAGGKFSLVEYKKYPRDILSMTLSPQARFGVGTRETVEQQNRSLSAPGPVRALAFYDLNRVLVAGDFQGIHVLSPDQGPEEVSAAKPGATVLAAIESNIAFGDGRSLTLASARIVRSRLFFGGVSRPSPLLLLTFLVLISPLAFYLVSGIIRLIVKKQTPPPKPREHDKPEEEGPVPRALVEACQNGECVLWAGAGLSAQSGLPVWSAFLRELAEWASKSDLAPAGVTETALAELSQGQTGAAADRLAAALQTQEQGLLYLRQRFWVTSELPPAHRLLREVDFQGVVTTNLDNLLDRAFPHSGGRVYTAGKCEELAKAAQRRDFFLLKPYGDLEEPETVCLGPAQCKEAIGHNPACAEFLEELFESRVFLFIGASLDGLERDLGNLTLPAPAGRKHYALTPATGEGWLAAAARLRERYGIETLTYAPSTAQHPEVVEFLTKLLTIMRQFTPSEEYFTAGE